MRVSNLQKFMPRALSVVTLYMRVSALNALDRINYSASLFFLSLKFCFNDKVLFMVYISRALYCVTWPIAFIGIGFVKRFLPN